MNYKPTLVWPRSRTLRFAVHRIAVLLVVMATPNIALAQLDSTATLWPGGVVPYEYVNASAHGNSVAVVEAAIAAIEAVSDIDFVERDGTEPYFCRFNFVGITSTGSCNSGIGAGNPTTVNVGDSCDIGSMKHELMHALGFHHEQSRDDRDLTAEVNELIGSANWAMFQTENLNPYDPSSIMQYPTGDRPMSARYSGYMIQKFDSRTSRERHNINNAIASFGSNEFSNLDLLDVSLAYAGEFVNPTAPPVLGLFQPSAPLHGSAAGAVSAVTLGWTASTNAVTYEVAVSEYPNFQGVPVYYNTAPSSQTNISVSGLALGRVYFWRVTAVGPGGSRATTTPYVSASFFTANQLPDTLYVDASASPGGDGSTWASAFRYLDEALLVGIVTEASGEELEIRVAGGEYRPSAENDTYGNRLMGGVWVRGGYAGAQFGQPDDFDPVSYPVFLKPPLSSQFSSGAILQARGSDGAGMIRVSDITLVSESPPANPMYNSWKFAEFRDSDVTMERVRFTGIQTKSNRGVLASDGKYNFIECTWSNIVIEPSLGSVYSLIDLFDSDQVLISRSVIESITVNNYDPLIARGNTPALILSAPGVLDCIVENTTIRDCTLNPGLILGNGGDTLWVGSPFKISGDPGTREFEFQNVTFNNLQVQGGTSLPWQFTESVAKLRFFNCVAIDTPLPLSGSNGGAIEYKFSLLAGADSVFNVVGVNGNLSALGVTATDLFLDPAAGDFTPKAGSLLIDAGSSGLLPQDDLDVDMDGDFTEPLPTLIDLYGNLRRSDIQAVVDIGAGQFPIVDIGAVERQCAADFTYDGILDGGDLSAFAAAFISQDPAADINGDGVLDNGDISAFTSIYLAGCP